MALFRKYLKNLLSAIITKNQQAEQIKAGQKWDSIVEEIRTRN